MMMTTERSRLDEQVWVDFGKDLLHEKAGSAQNDFLDACLSGKEGFMEYIHEHLLSRSGHVLDGGLVDLEHNFSEREFLHPPKSTQQIIWNAFRSESIEHLYGFGRWGYAIIRMIETDRIEPCYLASNLNGTRETGLFAIDNAMKNPDTKMDDCVRRILRSMCNFAPRGKRIIFNDFHIGRSYWRWHWAHRMHQHIILDFDQILEVLDHINYGEFSAAMHTSRGQSYIGSENTLGGLLLFLEQEKKAQRKTHIRNIIKNIGYLSAWKAIEMQDPQTNKNEIEQIARGL